MGQSLNGVGGMVPIAARLVCNPQREFHVDGSHMVRYGTVGITERSRSQAVDWLVMAHEEHRLRPSTLFLAVAIFDRTMAATKVVRDQLADLVHVCLVLASKMEDTYPRRVRHRTRPLLHLSRCGLRTCLDCLCGLPAAVPVHVAVLVVAHVSPNGA